MMRSAVALPPSFDATALATIASGITAVSALEARAIERSNPASFWKRLRTRRTNSGRSQNVSVRVTRSRRVAAGSGDRASVLTVDRPYADRAWTTSSVQHDAPGVRGHSNRGVSGLVVLAAVQVEPEDFLVVVATSAVAGTIAALVTGRGLLLPAVVVELLLGVVIGPQVLGMDVSEFIQFFADLGLGMLFFFAGYEIDLHRIMGLPLRLAVLGWAFSLALAYGL